MHSPMTSMQNVFRLEAKLLSMGSANILAVGGISNF